jgi:transposase
MRIIGCDLHARQQTLAMLDTTTGEVVEVTLKHEGDNVREFYSSLPRPVRVGIEATGSMQWFLNLMEELGIECQVGHPAQIRAAAPRKQKNDRRDAELILKMLVEGRFPAIWLPSKELQDLCGLCCATVISGSACGREYKMRCSRLPWRMVYDEAPPCGAK